MTIKTIGIATARSLEAAVIILSVGLACLFAAPAGAQDRREIVSGGFVVVEGVNVRNGNFAVTYSAFEREQGVPYRRTYNSRSSNAGTFGTGWGSPFDTALVVLDRERVVVVENGNGALTAYGQVSSEDAEDLDLAVVSALAKARAPTARLRRLVADFRGLFSQRRPAPMPIDRTRALAGQVCRAALVEKRQGRWRRTRCDGVVEIFRPDGRLIESSSADPGDTLVLSWEGSRLRRVSRADGRRLDFQRTADTVRVVAEAGQEITYDMAEGRNIAVHETDAAPLGFRYDGQANLIGIDFIDTTHRDIAYDNEDRAKLITGRNGERTELIYRIGLDGQRETEVRNSTRTGAPTSTVYVFP